MLVLQRGEELVKTLTEYCIRERIHAATFTGLGAVEKVTIGYYDLEKREYFFRKEPGVFEVTSMNGNVALVEGKPFVHVHAALSRCDETLSVIGAHITEAKVAVTLEIFLITLDMSLRREYDEAIGLKLIQP